MVGTRSKKNIDRGISDKNNFDSAESIGLNVMEKKISELTDEGRDDYDYYEPTEELNEFNKEILSTLGEILEFSDENRNPSEDERSNFKYVEISSIDIETGEITDASTIPCDEELVPSRARKVIHENDIIISTVRPTRGAIAKIPKELENEICSTGFEVVRPKNGYNIDYVLYLLRSILVAKQFGKFASGSSYPAILDKHIRMTQVPIPNSRTQEIVAEKAKKANSKVKLLRSEITKIINNFEKESNDILKEKSKIKKRV